MDRYGQEAPRSQSSLSDVEMSEESENVRTVTYMVICQFCGENLKELNAVPFHESNCLFNPDNGDGMCRYCHMNFSSIPAKLKH